MGSLRKLIAIACVIMLAASGLAIVSINAEAAPVVPWQAANPMPLARAQAACIQSGDTEYIVGGYNRTAMESVTNTTVIYDLKTMTSSLGPNAPFGVRNANGAVGQDGRIYVFGGRDGGNTVLSVVQIFDPSIGTWTLGPAIPIPVSAPATVAVGSLIYLIGGSTGAYSDAVQILDTTTMTWHNGGTIPVPTAGAKAVASPSGLILTFGGINATGASRDIFQYFFGWSIRGQMPAPLIYHGVNIGADGLVYAVGGVNDSGIIPTMVDSSFCYDIVSSTWTALPELPFLVQGAGMAATSDGRIIMFGGANSSMVPTVNVEFLQIMSLSLTQLPPAGIKTGQSGLFSVTATSVFRPLQKITGTYSLMNESGVTFITADFSSVSGNTAVFEVKVYQSAPAGTYVLSIKNGQAHFATDTVTVHFVNLSVSVTSMPPVQDQIAALQAAYEQELALVNANFTAQLTALNESNAAQIANLNANLTALMTSLNANHAAQMESLMQEINATQAALAQAQLKLDASRDQLNTVSSTLDKKADNDLVVIAILLAVLAITILAMMIFVARNKGLSRR